MIRLRERLRAALERRIARLWYGEPREAGNAALIALLSPLSALVGWVARRRRARLRRLPAGHAPAIVVVGNLVAGGTGKTPATLALARALAQRGWRVGLLAGGYRARDRHARIVGPRSDAAGHGDEAVLLARESALPVAAGRRRDEALRVLLAAHPALDVVLSDDGLQHRWLPRSVEIAVFDARGAGNGRLLPAGPLREPLAHAATMDALLLNGAARPPLPAPTAFGFRVEPVALRELAGGRRVAPAEFVRLAAAGRVAALAGMAQPERFFETLRSMGIHPEEHPLPDHAIIAPALLASIDAPLIVMTAKDAVKCERFADRRAWVLEIEARLDHAFVDWLEERLRGQPIA